MRRIGTLPLRPLPVLQTEQSKESIKYESILCRHRRRPKGRQDGNSAMTPFSWNNPYAWPRKPLLAQNVVATSQPLAAQAGLQMLAAGGNAVDAILATAITLIAGRAGVQRHRLGRLRASSGTARKLHGLNASGRSPAAWTPDYFRGKQAMPARGWDTVTVPGCVSAWVELHGKFGKLPFAEAVRAGDRLRPRRLPGLADHRGAVGRRRSPSSRTSPASPRRSCRADAPPRAGRNIQVSRTTRAALEKIAATKGKAFYRGELAEKLEAARRSRAARCARPTWPRTARLGEAARDGLPRLHAARDPAQRPGHRRADGARHPGATSTCARTRSTAPTACTCRSRR